MDKWIDVNERLPEEKMNCLVHYVHSYSDDDGFWALGFVYFNGEQFNFGDSMYKITHWMPLPEPPKGE